MDIEDVKRDVSTLYDAAETIRAEIEFSYRGFNAQGAILPPEYVGVLRAATMLLRNITTLLRRTQLLQLTTNEEM